MSNSRKILGFAVLVSLLSGCHAAGPAALKVAKYHMMMPKKKNGYRVKAITALEKQYDGNHNGLIDPQEAMFLKQRLIFEETSRRYRKMDLNGDGVVDVEEYEAFRDEN